MKVITSLCLAAVAACGGEPQIAYESAPERTSQQSEAVDPGEAQALEQAEAECARQNKHAVAQRVEGETVYHCE
jgi:hypothetical protein